VLLADPVVVTVPVCESEVSDADPVGPPLEPLSETWIVDPVDPEARLLVVALDKVDDKKFGIPVEDDVPEDETEGETEEDEEEVPLSASPIA
jgi:hypothetical protein